MITKHSTVHARFRKRKDKKIGHLFCLIQTHKTPTTLRYIWPKPFVCIGSRLFGVLACNRANLTSAHHSRQCVQHCFSFRNGVGVILQSDPGLRLIKSHLFLIRMWTKGQTESPAAGGWLTSIMVSHQFLFAVLLLLCKITCIYQHVLWG